MSHVAIARKNAERGRPLTAREKLANLSAWLAEDASAIEARRAATVKQGAVHESAVGAEGSETPRGEPPSPSAETR